MNPSELVTMIKWESAINVCINIYCAKMNQPQKIMEHVLKFQVIFFYSYNLSIDWNGCKMIYDQMLILKCRIVAFILIANGKNVSYRESSHLIHDHG